MRTFWIVLITLIVTAGLVGGGGWWYMKNKAAKEKKDLQTQIDNLNKQINELKSSSSTSTSASTATSTAKDSTTNLDAAKAVVKKFLDAKKTRSLENAKPYMTTSYYQSQDQGGFAGTSSPSMGRYTITKAEYLTAADLYKVTAKVYQNLQNEEVGYSENVYMVENQSGKFLVNEVKEGEWTDTK